MAAGDSRDFEFIGGPFDGKRLPVVEQGEGFPVVCVVDHKGEPVVRKSLEGSPWSQHRYERDGKAYRYLGPLREDWR